jgi:hypothetical protein
LDFSLTEEPFSRQYFSLVRYGRNGNKRPSSIIEIGKWGCFYGYGNGKAPWGDARE